MLSGEKILITGCAGQVALPIARALAADNEVYGLARFRRDADRERLEALGVRCVPADLAKDSLPGVPEDFSLVLHFAVVKSPDANFDYDLSANAEGTGRLMYHCRRARAFLYCSSAAVYAEPGHVAVTEDAALGDNHRALMPTYSLCKVAAESMARFGARQWRVPTTIARLSVPYGDNGGWPWFHLMMMKAGRPVPVHVDAPSVFNPLHEDDCVAHIPRLLETASVPATVVNWGGSEAVSIEQWCAHLGEITGLAPKFRPTRTAIASLELDLTRMHALLGRTRVDWRDGLRRMVEALNPELLASSSA